MLVILVDWFQRKNISFWYHWCGMCYGGKIKILNVFWYLLCTQSSTDRFLCTAVIMLEANKVSGKPNITLHSTMSNKRGRGTWQRIKYFTAKKKKKSDKERSLSLSNVILQFLRSAALNPRYVESCKCAWELTGVISKVAFVEFSKGIKKIVYLKLVISPDYLNFSQVLLNCFNTLHSTRIYKR